MRNSLITMGMILVLVVCATQAQDVLTEVHIPRPGIQGMVSNVAPGDLTPEQLFYALNIDLSRTTGELRPRSPLRQYGNNSRRLYGGYGYFNPYTGRKLIVGVGDSVYYQYFDTNGVTISMPCHVGQFFVSDTFATNVSSGAGSYVFPTAGTYHDWTPHRDMLVHCDGRSLPIVFTTSDGSMRIVSVPDTITYNPRMLSMGLEAPGQLRVGMTDLAGSRLGSYRYSYTWVDTVTDTTSPMAIPSAVLYLDNHYPYLTQFEHPVCDSAFVTLLILRQKQDGQSLWYVIDSLSLETTELIIKSSLYGFFGNQATNWKTVRPNYTYELVLGPEDTTDGSENFIITFDTTATGMRLDSLVNHFADTINSHVWDMGDSLIATAVGEQLSITTQDVCSTFYNGFGGGIYLVGTSYDEAVTPSDEPIVYIDTIPDSATDGPVMRTFINPTSSTFPQPGALWPVSWSSTMTPDGHSAFDDSTYTVHYTYYDPVTGMESSPGPTLQVILSDSAATIRFRALRTGTSATGKPKWIRLYQGINKSTLYGGGDTTVWYGLYEMRTGDTAVTIIWGNWSDVDVNTGLDTSEITKGAIYDYQVFFNISGDPIIRPPYIYDNQIPFSDIDKFGGRFFGIGDPVCPSCVYYSGYDTVWNWYMTDPFVLGGGVNDELVAIEHLSNTLYAFKHNSIWAISGSDVEYNLTFEQMTGEIGAVSRRTVVKTHDAIYFLSSGLDVYRLGMSGLENISGVVADYVKDTLFYTINGYATASAHARMYALNSAIILQNDSTARLFTYDIVTGKWGETQYESGFVPLGSFAYDSTENVRGFGYASDLLFMDSTIPLVYEDRVAAFYKDWDYGIPWAGEFSLPGNGKDLFTVTQISATVFPYEPATSSELHYTIYRYKGDSLVTDSTTFSRSIGDNERLRFTWDVLPHDAESWLSVKLWTMANDTVSGVAVTNCTYISDVTFTLKYEGRDEAQ